MQKILLTLCCVCWIASLKAQNHTPPYISKSLADANLKNVEVQTSGGNISVIGVPASEARIEVYIFGNHSDELSKAEIQKRLDADYDFSISTSNNKLTALAKPKGHSGWRNGLSVSFKIYAPVEVSTLLRSSGGNIQLRNLSGSVQDFKTSGGNLDIDMVNGKIVGKTSGGNISLTDSKNDIDIRTSGGNIEVANCQGKLEMHTSGGNLSLKMMQGTVHSSTSGGNIDGEAISGDFQTETSGGNIRLEGLSCNLTAATSGGDIQVSMKSLDKFLNLSNSSGNISLELPRDKGMNLQLRGDKVKTGKLTNFQGEVDENHVTGTVNGGGTAVKVDGNSGRVSVTLR